MLFLLSQYSCIFTYQNFKNNMKKTFLFACLFALASNSFGFDFTSILFKKSASTNQVGKFYRTGDDDAFIFSWTGAGKGPMGKTFDASNVRFSMFFNTGTHFNYNVAKNISVFTGIGLRNVGSANRAKNAANGITTVSRNRSYYIGVPIGIRFGDFEKNTNVSLGGGLDITLNYKEKSWQEGSKRSTKGEAPYVKQNFWFESKRTPLLNPYIFVAAKKRGVGLKFQYYLNGFTQQITTDASGKIISTINNNDNLMYISLLFDGGKGLKAKTKTKKIKKSINSI
jgi:hypothetical protein